MFSTQHKVRNKNQKILCPKCFASSRKIDLIFVGIQKRECRHGHIFYYSYLHEAFTNWLINYQIKL